MSRTKKALVVGVVVGSIAAVLVLALTQSLSTALACFVGGFFGMTSFSLGFDSLAGTGSPLHNRIMGVAERRQARRDR